MNFSYPLGTSQAEANKARQQVIIQQNQTAVKASELQIATEVTAALNRDSQLARGASRRPRPRASCRRSGSKRRRASSTSAWRPTSSSSRPSAIWRTRATRELRAAPELSPRARRLPARAGQPAVSRDVAGSRKGISAAHSRVQVRRTDSHRHRRLRGARRAMRGLQPQRRRRRPRRRRRRGAAPAAAGAAPAVRRCRSSSPASSARRSPSRSSSSAT